MDPLTMGLVSGAIQGGTSLLGGILGSGAQQATNAQQMAFAEQQQQQAEAFNAQQADAQRGWQEYMLDTQYARSMESMRNAGLNPILAASSGLGGGGAPGGATASIGMTSAPLGSPGSALQAGVTSAGDAVAKGAAVTQALTQAGKDKSQTDLNRASEDLTNKTAEKAVQDTATSKSAEDLNKAATTKTTVDAATSAANASAAYANANSANALARVNTRVAEDAERFGTSSWGSGIASVLRLLQTGVNMVPSSAQGVKSNPVQSIINSVPQPQTALPPGASRMDQSRKLRGLPPLGPSYGGNY